MNQNLFHYATSELSQDAFICWLLSHGTEENKGTTLYDCAMAMLKKMCRDKCLPKEVIKIERQYYKIDVLIEVYAENDKHYWLIIEDKTGTSEHDDQLDRYIGTVEKEKKAVRERIIGVYYKSGIQGILNNVENAGYHIMLRDDILEVLKEYKDSGSEILKDYYDNLNDAKNKAEEYIKHPYKEWDWPQIEAFFDSLIRNEKYKNQFAGFEYVANKNGGFIAMWNNGKEITGKSWTMYLQLEFKPQEAKICLKGTVDDEKENYKTQGNAVIDMISPNGKYKLDSWFIRPKRLVSAHSMTLGVREINGKQTQEEIQEDISSAIEAYEKCVQSVISSNT